MVQRELLVASRKRATYRVRAAAALSAFVITFFMVNFGLATAATTSMGARLFHALTTIAFWVCFFGGSLLTADCLSVERRNDTLGLLFLTDLKGYDVVFGKLVAKSLAGMLCLIATVPMLAIPLLLGGVTAGEFWRTIAVLLNTLLFSLSIGMIVSVVSRDPRNVFAAAIFFMALVAWGIPLVGTWLGGASVVTPLLWKIYPFAGMSFARPTNFSAAPDEYFTNVGLLLSLSVLLLAVASSWVTRSWGVRPPNRLTAKLRQAVRRITHGTREQQAELRARLLDVNPVLWMHSRERSLRTAMFVLFAVLASCAFALNFNRAFYWTSLVSPMVCFVFLYLLFVALVAFESASYMIERRKDGGIELLLSTSLTTDEILGGHVRAAWRLFTGAALVMTVYAVAWLWIAVQKARGEDRWLALVFPVVMLASLFVSAHAIVWCGMRYSLRARSPAIPALRAVATITGMPLFWTFVACLPAVFVMDSQLFTWVWIAVTTVVHGLVLRNLAREHLQKNFRASFSEPLPMRRASDPS